VPAVSVSPVSSVADPLDRWRAGDRVQLLGGEFLDVLAMVPDPRDRRGRRYPLGALLAIAVLATAAGMRGYAGFATWARTAPEDVLAQLGIPIRPESTTTHRVSELGKVGVLIVAMTLAAHHHFNRPAFEPTSDASSL